MNPGYARGPSGIVWTDFFTRLDVGYSVAENGSNPAKSLSLELPVRTGVSDRSPEY